MPQEFLASFAVDIDEGGVNRLQRILQQNRERAEQLASAFDKARSSMEAFIQAASQDLTALPFFQQANPVEEAFGTSGTFAIDLNFDKVSKQLESFLAGAKKQLCLSADASGIVSAVSSAISQARSMLASANLKLAVKTETETDSMFDGSGAGAGPVRYLSTGGRFTSPTKAEIAEDGGTEYVIPISKENEAVPLIRSLLSELSAPARESLKNTLPVSGENEAAPLFQSLFAELSNTIRKPANNTMPASKEGEAVPLIRSLFSVLSESFRESPRDTLPFSGERDVTAPERNLVSDLFDSARESLRDVLPAAAPAISAIPEMLSAAPAAAAPNFTQHTENNNVQAPVNIHVEAASASPEAIGKTIYNTAERYLLRTLQGVKA